jgi:hypothetical protein
MLLADRNFAAAGLIGQIAATGADVLVRCKTNRRLPRVRGPKLPKLPPAAR